VLKQSLHGAAMIALGMEEQADAVERTWDKVIQKPGQPRRRLPHGIWMLQIVEEAKEALLILDRPGSGKKTTLLVLARDSTIAICQRIDPYTWRAR
jgi:DNA polymerase III delta prime subunit